MNYKPVVEEQIRELQKLQDKNMSDQDIYITERIENAIKISDQINKCCETAKGLV